MGPDGRGPPRAASSNRSDGRSESARTHGGEPRGEVFYPTINIVRRAEQVELLHKMGAEHLVNSSDPGFDARLGDRCRSLGASIGFEAVAGDMSARVLRAQPRGSGLLVYGALSLEASQIDPHH
jgi:NADPH:quinone reductase-like Zn-dependent oxidoreductase